MKIQFHKLTMGTNIRNFFYEHKFDGPLKNFVIFSDLCYGKCHELLCIDLNTNGKKQGIVWGPYQEFLSN